MHNIFRIIVLTLVFTTAVAQGPRAVQEARMSKVTPLGGDTIKLMPVNRVLSFMVSAESSKLRDARVLNVEGRKVVKGADGNEITHYPDDLVFRFTISSKAAQVERTPLVFDAKVGVGELTTNMRFKLHRFKGLESEEIDPEKAEMIGVPANVPYNERIYRVKFKTADFSIEDRLMFEIIAPNGARLGKFHFYLM